MSWFEALVLGVVQGLTEFLPISSSAHLSIVGQLAGWGDPGAAFTAVTQLGTEAAVLVYFRKDITRIITHWVGSLIGKVPRTDPDARMGWLVIIGSLPIGIIGFFGRDFIETNLRDLRLTATMLAVFAIVIAIADRRARNEKELTELTWRDGVIYGFGQAMALVPGVSRSGGTIATGLFLGYKREAATRYSFLLAIPAVLASGLFELRKIGGDDGHAPDWGPTILATIVAFGVGYAVIAWLLRYISTHNFTPFVVYRLILASAVFGLIVAGYLETTHSLG